MCYYYTIQRNCCKIYTYSYSSYRAIYFTGWLQILFFASTYFWTSICFLGQTFIENYEVKYILIFFNFSDISLLKIHKNFLKNVLLVWKQMQVQCLSKEVGFSSSGVKNLYFYIQSRFLWKSLHIYVLFIVCLRSSCGWYCITPASINIKLL